MSPPDTRRTLPDEIGQGSQSDSLGGDGITPSVPHSSSDLDGWADRIRPHLVATVEHIIAVGRELNAAKSALPHGAFGPLLDELGLSRQMANRFMRVANSNVITNRSPVGGLPAAVSVLDELTKLDDDTLTTAIDTGDVTPSTTRAEAELLVESRRRIAALPDEIRDVVENTVAGCKEWFPIFDDLLLIEIVTVQAAARCLWQGGELRLLSPPSWWPAGRSFRDEVLNEIAEHAVFLHDIGIDESAEAAFLADGPLALEDHLADDALLAWTCPDEFTIEDRRHAALGRWFAWESPSVRHIGHLVVTP